jgi:hypothetical protein
MQGFPVARGFFQNISIMHLEFDHIQAPPQVIYFSNRIYRCSGSFGQSVPRNSGSSTYAGHAERHPSNVWRKLRGAV